MPVATVAVGAGDERDKASPVDGLRERLADPDVVERRLRRVESVVARRQRGALPQLRAERIVVGDPRRVEREDVRQVDVAVLERLDRAPAADVVDQLDRRDLRLARPVVVVRDDDGLLGVGRLERVRAAADEARRLERARIRSQPGRHDRECWARDDRHEVRRWACQADLDVEAVGLQADRAGVCVLAAGVGEGALDVADQRDQRRRLLRVENPQPAADDVVTGDGRAVGERQVGAEVEDDPPAAIEDVPRFSERGPDVELGIERGEALEQLRGDRGAADVALEGGVERRGRPDEDLDRVARGRRPRSVRLAGRPTPRRTPR
jgi:hypothetical protein